MKLKPAFTAALKGGMVIDLIESEQPQLWSWCQEFIRKHCKSDALYDNYLNLDLSQFLSFPVVVEDDRIVAFSGVQFWPERWSPFVARISARMWIHPDRRELGLTKFTPGARTWYNSQLILPQQLAVVRRHPTIKAVFITRHDHRRSFGRFIQLVNAHNDLSLEILGRHYVCGPHLKLDACHQHVAAAAIRPCTLKDLIEGALGDATD